MRTLTPTLLEAQRSPAPIPVIGQLLVSTRRWGILLPGTSQLYSEAASGQRFAACVAPDGSVVRARITPSGELYVNRVASPQSAPPSAWASWNLLATGVSPSVTPALGSTGTAQVMLAYVRSGQQVLATRVSTDNAQSWGSEITAYTESGTDVIHALAVGTKYPLTGTNERIYAWVYGPPTAGPSDKAVRVRRRAASGSWGTVVTWTGDLFQAASGLAIAIGADASTWQLVTTGRREGASAVWTCSYNDSTGAWTPPQLLDRAEDADHYAFSQPSIVRLEATHIFWHATRPEATGRTHYCMLLPTGSTLPTPTQVQEPAIATADYLLGERSAWRLDRTEQSIDLAQDVLTYTYREPHELVVTLQFGDRWPRGNAPATLPEILRVGSCVRLSRGLQTSEGVELVPLPEMMIASLDRHWEDGAPLRATIRCISAWEHLATTVPQRPRTWPRGSRTTAQLLAEICALGGIELEGMNASELQAQPPMTIPAGTSLQQAITDALRRVPHRMRPEGEVLQLADPRAGVVATYGAGEHPLWEYRDQQLQAPNYVQVYGLPETPAYRGQVYYGEALGDIELGARIRKVVDPLAGSSQEAATVAAAHLLALTRSAQAGRLKAPPHLGLQVWDHIRIIPQEGAEPIERVVTGLEERYDAGTWQQVIHLGRE